MKEEGLTGGGGVGIASRLTSGALLATCTGVDGSRAEQYQSSVVETVNPAAP